MITNDEAITLLELAASGDNRSISKANVMLWRGVAQKAGWTYQQGVQAIIEHKTYKPGVYLEAGHITVRVQEVRAEIRARRLTTPLPPHELGDDPVAERAWQRREAVEFVERNLALWADGEPFEDVPAALEADIVNEKRGELPSSRISQEMLRFTAKTKIPRSPLNDRVDDEAERKTRAKADRDALWARVDACELCDTRGERDGLVCPHEGQVPTPRVHEDTRVTQ